MQRREQRPVDPRTSSARRAQRAREPLRFADAYAERCGAVAIEELVEIYRLCYPESNMNYGIMRAAAVERGCSIFEHGGSEYTLSEALCDIAPWEVTGIVGKIAANHREYPVKLLDEAAVAQEHLGFIRYSPAMDDIVRELFGLLVCNSGHSDPRPDRHQVRTEAAEIIRELGIQAKDIADSTNPVTSCSARLMCLTYPDRLLATTPLAWPTPQLKRAVGRLVKELPLWNLNGWSAREFCAGKVPSYANCNI